MGQQRIECAPRSHKPLVLLLCAVLASVAASYEISECAQACATCVSFYGRELYDGRSCILNCRATEGSSLDDMCQNESYHLVKKSNGASLLVNTCRKYCGLCVLRWSKTVYHGAKCARMCDLSRGLSVDSECADPTFNRLDKSNSHNEVLLGQK